MTPCKARDETFSEKSVRAPLGTKGIRASYSKRQIFALQSTYIIFSRPFPHTFSQNRCIVKHIVNLC